MAVILIPDAIRYEHGLCIREKIIPDTAVWQKDYRSGATVYSKGTKYKANLKLSGGTGRVQGVTIHNTDRIAVTGTTPAEQYTRATWPNCNMGTVRTHYYVDETGAWQNLRENEVGWHAADGNYGPGNNTTIAIEIIMGGNTAPEDLASEENGALLCACLLSRYALSTEKVYQHHDFYPAKDCPVYIRPHWAQFLGRVKEHLAEFSSQQTCADSAALSELQKRYESLTALYEAQRTAMRTAAGTLLAAAGQTEN